jgi:hypothetical protein
MVKKENKIIIYKDKDIQTNIAVNLDKDTVWLNQGQMAVLFGKDTNTVGGHIKNVFAEGELTEKRTTRKSRVVQKEGNREVERDIEFYNLDVIISVLTSAFGQPKPLKIIL